MSVIADRMHCCLKLCSSSKVFMDLYLFACFMHFSNLRSSQVGVSTMIGESKLSGNIKIIKQKTTFFPYCRTLNGGHIKSNAWLAASSF